MHEPVLLKEVLEIFKPRPGQKYIDATIDGGGHTMAIFEKIQPEGKLLGIDWDCDLINSLKNKNNLLLTCDNYANIKSISGQHNLGKVNGILFDLGFSSYHIEKSGRGFSFLKDEPLDMRYNPHNNALTAKKIINEWPREAIENIIREYGEEKFAKRIALNIVKERNSGRISTTGQLVKIISKSLPPFQLKQRIHFATRTFQALRIAVNNELENFKNALNDSIDILTVNGIIIVISFHSLEDRIAKNIFKEKSKIGAIKIITKKPVGPAVEELAYNPRARSAKLRAAQKLTN